MTIYCIGVLALNYDTFNRNHDILFTVEHKDDIPATQEIIAQHYSRTIKEDLEKGVDSDASRFIGCSMSRGATTSKETYDVTKKFTFEYKGD